MSECVVRMEMPSKDRMCQMADDIDGVWYCPVKKRICHQPDNGDIPSWCPIICSLPEGHGRLVSEKDVRWVIDDIVLEIAERIGHVPMTKNETMEYVNQLPTIVPAERSET